jgi:hypothetical protein
MMLLAHARAPYDPRKAHEYYLRTRKLKGRKSGTAVADFRSGDGKSSYTVKLRDGKTAKLNEQQLAEQRLYAEARVQSIQKKLVELNKALKEKMAEARKAEAEANKPKTAAEKAKAARDAKKYRDKNQQKLKNARAKKAAQDKPASEPKPDSVEGLKKTIEKAKKSLDAALERQRSLASATKTG